MTLLLGLLHGSVTLVETLHLLFLEKSFHKLRCVDCYLLGQLIESLFDFVFALDTFLLHFSLNSFKLIFLCLLKLSFLLHVFLLGR